MKAASHLYLIALGSNQPHHVIGRPAEILRQATAALESPEIDIFSVSKIMRCRPIGPSQREFANCAALLLSPLNPTELLDRLKAIEAHFGRRDMGQNWRARILDIDIILWEGGFWSDNRVTLPHPEFHKRNFVLTPSAEIAPKMRDSATGLTIKQLQYRFLHPKRLDPNENPA